jgi:hypothetical protein
LLPASLALWIGLETIGFGMIFVAGLHDGGLVVGRHAGHGAGSAFYLSGGAITSLTFGDFVPRSWLYRTLADLETVIGLSTFTLALTYVLSAFDAQEKLRSLYARVRRNAVEPHRPSTIIERRYRSGDASYYSSFLQAVTEEVDGYNEALRRFPVAFYFHTRRLERSTPRVLRRLAQLIELTKWGLPDSDPLTRDPNLLALLDEYVNMMDRLRRSFFLGTDSLTAENPDREEFVRLRDDSTTEAAAFSRLQQEALRASGLEEQSTPSQAYEQFCGWLQFHRLTDATLNELSDALGYPEEVE